MSPPLSILVTDTSIWIDLHHGGILPEFFRLPYRIVATDLAASREFYRPGWQVLESLGLEIVELDPDKVAELILLRAQYSALSAADLSAFIVARDLEGILLTGDQKLRMMVEGFGMRVHGLLWCLDQLVAHGVVDPLAASLCLQQIVTKGGRLPTQEVKRRLNEWGA